MPTELPGVISRYFERDADRDIDSIVDLFANDATVIDEGEERHGTAAIRPRFDRALGKRSIEMEALGVAFSVSTKQVP